MKKISLFCAFVLCIAPLFSIQAAAASMHIAAGLPNYRLIIGCVIGGALAVFLLAMFTMKYRRKDDKETPAEEAQAKTEASEDEKND